MLNQLLRLSAATAMLVSTPALASAEIGTYRTTSPVAITSFGVNEVYESGEMGGDAVEAPQSTVNGIVLRFVNQADVAATTVIFMLNAGSYSRRIVDKGIFSPKTLIRHSFGIDGAANGFDKATVNVAEVDFVDGTVWQAAPIGQPRREATSADRAISPAERERENSEARRAEFRDLGTSL